MSNNEQARIGWIDEFKGFVLLLVCLFHIEQSFSHVSLGMLHLSALRMSAFFFISGMLFSTRRFSNFRDYLVHKTRVLLVPYILLSLLFLALDPVLYNFDLFPKAPRMTVMNIRPEIASVWDYLYWNLAKIFMAGKSSIGSGPLWFVFTLYSVSLMFYGVQRAAQKIPTILSPLRGSRMTSRTIRREAVYGLFKSEKTNAEAGMTKTGAGMAGKVTTFFIACAALAGGWTLYRNHIRLPLGIERDLTVLFFFACGWLCKGFIQTKDERRETRDSQKKRNLILAAAAIVSFAVYAAVKIPDPNFSIMNNDLGKSLPRLVASSFFGIAGLVASFMLADKLPDTEPIRSVKGILRNISRNALVILAVHWYILLVMRLLFKEQINRPGIAYVSFPIIAIGVIAAIPLFRCKLYKLLGKKPATLRESLSIKE